MAGLWEYVKETTEVRTPSHAIFSALVAYANGDFTKPQILTYLNAETRNGTLDAAAETDLNGIATNIDGKNASQIVQYLLVIHGYNMAAEDGAFNETVWRNRLEIT
jgi:hypothetical protein